MSIFEKFPIKNQYVTVLMLLVYFVIIAGFSLEYFAPKKGLEDLKTEVKVIKLD